MSTTPPQAAERGAIYGERRDRFQQLAEAAASRAEWIAHGRLLAFLIGAASALAMWQGPPRLGPLAEVAIGACTLGYAWLAVVHGRVLAEVARLTGLKHRNQLALARLARDFAALPAFEAASHWSAPARAVSGDLDVAGPASLLRLLSTAETAFGRQCLGDWLFKPAPPEVILARQAAVAELAPALDLRDEVGALGAATASDAWDVEGFVRWAEGEPWLARRRWLQRLAPLLALVTVTLAVLDGTGLWAQKGWLLGAGVNLLVTWRSAKAIHGVFARVESRREALAACARLLAQIDGAGLRSPLLIELQGRLRAGGAGAERELARLGRLVGWTELRLTPVLYFPLQILTLWDLHWLGALERWQARVGKRGRDWLTTLGEFEALASLAGLAHAHPDWAFPVVSDAIDRIDARGLGHPLLPDQRRVDNDLQVGPQGTFVLLTGSNMSGKSTLLRALGLNVILAQAGGPVCAQSLRLPPLRLATSLRVQDSLEAGLSRFMAELTRLREVLAAATTGSPPLLYLLDEILAGTNAPERRAAVPLVLRQLLAAQAIGVLTTHDPEIVEAPGLLARCQSMHFTDTVARADGKVVIAFDYLLRPGLAPSGNALAFLEAVGLGAGVSEGGRP